MSSTTHTAEANLAQTKEFAFVLVTDMPPRNFYAQPPHNERAQTEMRLHIAAEESSLRAFHEEFKRLVLASNESVPTDFVDESNGALLDAPELEWSHASERVALKRLSPSLTFAA